MVPEPSPRNLLTAIIIAKDEAGQIEAAIGALLWADEILVVVDSSSTDRTRELAESFGSNVRVVVHEFEGYAAQRNWSIGAASNPWIFMMDADERPSETLVASIQTLLRKGPERDAYQVYRRNFMFGRELKHGGLANDRVTRLFRRNLRYSDRLVHEELCGGRPLGVCKGHLVHLTFRDLGHYLEKMHGYAILGAKQEFRADTRADAIHILLRPVHRFFKQFLWRGGFLDGMPGTLYACMASYSVFLKYAVLWDLQRQQRGAPRRRFFPVALPADPCIVGPAIPSPCQEEEGALAKGG